MSCRGWHSEGFFQNFNNGSIHYLPFMGYKILKPFVYLQHETADYNIWQIFWRIYGGADCQGEGESGRWTGVAEDSGPFAGKVCLAYSRWAI